MVKQARLFLCILSFGSPLIGFADWRDIAPDYFKLPPPPAIGSKADLQDLRGLHEMEHTRTSDQCKVAQHQKFPNPPALFGPKTGLLNEGETKRTNKFLSHVFAFVSKVTKQFKEGYARERPYMRDSSLRPCITKPGDAKTSYPSSHAAMGIVGACTLAKIFPGRAAQLKEQGEKIGKLRAVVGVHHPTDVIAGQKLGHEICEALLKDRSFREEISGLKR